MIEMPALVSYHHAANEQRIRHLDELKRRESQPTSHPTKRDEDRFPVPVQIVADRTARQAVQNSIQDGAAPPVVTETT